MNFLSKAVGVNRAWPCCRSTSGMFRVSRISQAFFSTSVANPLEGIMVVSLEQAVAGPYISSRLADAGARVIKIERDDGKGDFARGYDKFADGLSSYFVWLNRGKESVELNLKVDQDIKILKNMLSKADVFIQNFAPGATDRMGLGSQELREQYPRLITVDISGYGAQADELQSRKAYDMLIQAESGLSDISGLHGEPSRVGVSICDICCGMYGHTAVLEALASRDKYGNGTGIEVSLFSAIADWLTVPLSHFEHDGLGPSGLGLNHPSVHPYGVYTCKGSRILIAVQNEREFASFCHKVLERPNLAGNDLFKDNVSRCSNRGALDAIISDTFSSQSAEELVTKLADANVAFAQVNGMEELSAHKALARVEVPTEKGIRSVIAPPVRFDGKHRKLGKVPSLGEHTAALKNEFG
jgi:itaconate CoA-transferase